MSIGKKLAHKAEAAKGAAKKYFGRATGNTRLATEGRVAVSRPGTFGIKPSNSPTRWGNAKRSPTRPRPRPAPLKPRPKPRPRTRRAYNTKPKCVAATRPPPATR